jgi:hypothetical protein
LCGTKEQTITKRTFLCALILALLYLGGASGQFPVMDAVANGVIQKYQSSTCEQVWIKKSEKTPPSPKEKEAIEVLKSNPQMRTAFINKIAAPIANKMFDCGMIP